MKIGLNVMGSEALFDGDVSGVLDMIERADRAGVDQIAISDHLGFNGAAHAERRRTHAFPFVLEQPWYEPISFLSAVAARTSRVRLSTFVLIAPLRPPLLLAKQLATLDVISKGRVTIGLGAGWQAEEFAAAGMPFEGRFAALDETVQALRALWSEPPARFRSTTFQFDDFYSLPPPAQGARIPILFGLHPTLANFDRIARLGEGWAVNPAHMPHFAERAAELRRAFTDHGRDLDDLEIHVGQGVVRSADGSLDKAETRRRALALPDAGATTVTFSVAEFCETAGDIDEFLEFVVGLKG